MDYRKIITVDPDIRNGQPCIRGLPITVSDVLGYLASGMTVEEVLAQRTQLTREDILACLQFAAGGLDGLDGGSAPAPHPVSPRPRGPAAANEEANDKHDG
jgi:uncharacterized protein (DUF433 family)